MSDRGSLHFAGAGFDAHGRAVLDDVTLGVRGGEFVALLGPNGAGKSTLLRAALGLVRLRRGSVEIGGRAVSELSPAERAARVAWLPQQLPLSEPVSVVELVATARYRFHEGHALALERAHAALEQVGARIFAERSVLTLSGGERQRVLLAVLLAQGAPLLLLDEPANHLDPAQQVELYRLLGRLWQAGLTLVCVTHDVNLIRHLPGADDVRICGMSSGRLAFDVRYGAPELPELLGELYGLELRALELDGGRVLVARGGAPG